MLKLFFILLFLTTAHTQATNPLSERNLLLEQNKADISENQEITKKNIATLKSELSDLKQLSQEYLTLQTKYTQHTIELQKKLDQNNAAITKIGEFIEKLPKNESQKREKALAELAEREVTETQGKNRLEHVQKLSESINASLKNIDTRVTPIKQQLEQQEKKLTDYEKILKDIEKKQAEIQRAIKALQLSKESR